MELDDRKLKILQTIIRTYLETGEPVGSRTISKDTDLNLSSATIRNEMSDLEEMGYIIQPHTSAGRVPSDKGYRLYVDTMLDDKTSEVMNLKDELEQKAGKIDVLLKQVAKLHQTIQNYATLVSGPRYESKKVKFIQLTQVDADSILAVIVLDDNVVKNEMVRVEGDIDQEMMVKLNFILNTTLNGLDVTEMNLAIIRKIKEQVGSHTEVIDSVLEVIGKALTEDDDLEIYTSGATNILKYPELSDKASATELLNAFEEKNIIGDWLDTAESESGENGQGKSKPGDTHDIQVYIGNETKVDTMKDCSVVTATYKIHEGVYGKIGIVGPKRMDYDKVVSTLQSLMSELDDIFKKKQKLRGGRELAAENKDIEKDIDIEEVKEDNTADEAVEEEKAAEDAKDKKDEASKEAAPKKEKKFGKKKDKAVEKLEEKVKELEDMRVRQLAEFENFRKRSEKEKSQMFEVGAKSVIEKILPVIDNFERGLQGVPEEEKDAPFVKGVEMVYKQMLTAFDEMGVKPIDAVGKEFDPNLHNAVMAVDDDSLESGTVAEEMQKGYMYKDKVLRTAMVKVSE